MTINHHPDCTVIVSSCDKYADLLAPFSTLWKKFWPDCPFELVLVTESTPTGQLAFDRIVACGPGGSWCSRLVRALGEISTPYVLMLCDDYYLTEPVDTVRILRRLADAKTLGADNLRLIPNPPPGRGNSDAINQSDLRRYHPNTAYAIATQAGFWNCEFLRNLASDKASIWEFERYGSFDKCIANRTLLVTPSKEFPFCDAVHKGHWEKSGIALLKVNGITYDFSVRSLPPFTIVLREALKALIFRIFPPSLIVRVQNAFDLGMKEKH